MKLPQHFLMLLLLGGGTSMCLILWIVINEPKKTIAIDFRLKLQRKPGYSQWGHHDIIVRVSPGPVCVVANLPGSPRSSGDSMAIAGAPDTRPCIAPEEFEKP
jgi:hypothetical protein